MLHLSATLFLCFSVCPPFLADSHCVTLCSFCVSRWKLGTPNYGGLSIIMYLAGEMYRSSVPPWKKRAPNINWGILQLRSISMFLTLKVTTARPVQIFASAKKRKLMLEKMSAQKKSIPFLTISVYLKNLAFWETKTFFPQKNYIGCFSFFQICFFPSFPFCFDLRNTLLLKVTSKNVKVVIKTAD